MVCTQLRLLQEFRRYSQTVCPKVSENYLGFSKIARGAIRLVYIRRAVHTSKRIFARQHSDSPAGLSDTLIVACRAASPETPQKLNKLPVRPDVVTLWRHLAAPGLGGAPEGRRLMTNDNVLMGTITITCVSKTTVSQRGGLPDDCKWQAQRMFARYCLGRTKRRIERHCCTLWIHQKLGNGRLAARGMSIFAH